MNDSKLEIKEQRKGLFAKGITFLLLMIASLLVAFLPLLYSNANSNALLFYITGGIAFAVFTFLFALLLYKECNPGNALILNSHGFKAIKNVGEDIEIEWTNVSSVKILGKKDTPYLGISLENCDIVIAKMRKNEADEMRENIEENLPHILISQNELRTSVRELKDIFVKFVRESRALENDIPKKAKSNPFSTEDVLRAFGKLPKENDSEAGNKPCTDKPKSVSETKSEIEETVIEHEERTHTDSNFVDKESDITASSDSSEDSFYSLLKQQLDSPADINSSEQDTISEDTEIDNDDENDIAETVITESNEEMPDELLAILSQAKSSKIDELGKILNDSSPVSFSQNYISEPNENKVVKSKFEIVNESQTDTVLGSLPGDNMLDTSSAHTKQPEPESESDSFKIILPDELYEEKPLESEGDITFEDLINMNNNAAKEVPHEKNDFHDDKTDTKEFYPDLLKLNGNKNTNYSDDDGELIIPDLSEYDE